MNSWSVAAGRVAGFEAGDENDVTTADADFAGGGPIGAGVATGAGGGTRAEGGCVRRVCAGTTGAGTSGVVDVDGASVVNGGATEFFGGTLSVSGGNGGIV